MTADSLTDIRRKRKLAEDYTELHFYDLVYRQYLIVLICDFDKFTKFLKDNAGHKYTDAFSSDTIGYCVLMDSDNNDIGNTCLIMWMRERDLTTLVHEITHLVHFIFDACGVPAAKDNTEAVAYYTEHWFKRITEAWVIPPTSDKLNHKEKSK